MISPTTYTLIIVIKKSNSQFLSFEHQAKIRLNYLDSEHTELLTQYFFSIHKFDNNLIEKCALNPFEYKFPSHNDKERSSSM